MIHPESGIRLTLLSMVHVGMAEYYRGLEAHLQGAGIVLEEGASGAAPKPEELASDLSWYPRFYRITAELLGGRRQRDWENEVRDARWSPCDLPLERIDAELRQQNVSLFTTIGKSHILVAEHLLELGVTGAERLRERDWVTSILVKGVLGVSGPGGASWSAMNDARNEEIFRRLRWAIAEGKHRSIAMVYGAAHVAALEPRILAELGFKLESVVWHDALVVELNSDTADACLRRGRLWAEAGNLEAAKADYYRALDIAPRNWPFRTRVEQLLQGLR